VLRRRAAHAYSAARPHRGVSNEGVNIGDAPRERGAGDAEKSRGPWSSVGHARINRSCEKAGCAPAKRGFEGLTVQFLNRFARFRAKPLPRVRRRSHGDSASARMLDWGRR
jgi:hypothetical protein